MGVEVTTSRLWARAAELDIARMLFVNMLDRERADFFRTLEALKRAFGQHVVATEIPIGSEHEIEGVIDLVDMKAFRAAAHRRSAAPRSEIPIPDAQAELAQEYREKLMDEVCEVSDALMERYLEGERDLARGDRRRAQGGHQPRQDLPGRLRRRDRATSAPRACSTRSSRTCPRRSSTARCRSARSS